MTFQFTSTSLLVDGQSVEMKDKAGNPMPVRDSRVAVASHIKAMLGMV